MTVKQGARVRAPELVGETWFNTGAALTLRELRGRFVLLDFWASCCANCLHVLDELRPLESSHADVLTVVGVHSPKFPHEAQPQAVAAAIERNGIAHPVLSDPDLGLWRQYAVRAWPTLVLVDPQGYVVAQAAGEGQVGALTAILDRLVDEHTARGTLHRGDGPYEAPPPTPGQLRFPAKAIALPAARTGRGSDSLLVADAGHHQLVELAVDASTVLRRIGGGRRREPFCEPNGLTLLPPGVADYDVLVADTASHVLHGVRLGDGAVVATVDLPRLVQGLTTVTGAVPAVLSPWDVAWWPAAQRVVIAAAGVHLLLGFDPAAGTVEILAGTTVEGLRDGPAGAAWLAQPSGLAVDGPRVWFVDAESSSLRYLTVDGTVSTAVGEGLFDFGFVDGPATTAQLQHPLGVTLLPDSSLAVADTFNGALRRYDPVTGMVSTLADGLAEPSGAVVLGEGLLGEGLLSEGLLSEGLLVVESAAHRLVGVGVALLPSVDRPLESARPSISLRAGRVHLDIVFDPPPGRTLDCRGGATVQLEVAASPPELLVAGAGATDSLTRELVLAPGAGVLQISARVATCDDDPAIEHPACHLSRQDWGVPVHIDEDGDATLQLTLLGAPT